jgi:hypothetical protein
MTLGADGRLPLLRADGSSSACRVDGRATTVFAWLVILTARHGGQTVALVLPVDALGAEGHRQLRVWLKWRLNAAAA